MKHVLWALAIVGLLFAGPTAAQSPGTVNLVGPSGGGQPITPGAINSAVNNALRAKQDYPGGGGGSLTVTDGTHTVTGTTNLTVSGGTVGGTTPNATLTISGGSSVTWPASTDLVISNGTNSPAGLAPINGDCVVGSGGAWTVASCPGGGGISGPGTTVNGFVPLWNGTTGSALSAGFGLGTGIQTALGVNVGSAGAPVLLGGAGGTPSSLTLTNATGLPVAGITGLGTGVGTALGIAVGSAGGPVTNGGALGTPSSGVATNLTGTAASLTAGTATVANGLKSATTTVSVSAATAPTNGQVLKATSGTTATWQAEAAGCTITTNTPNLVPSGCNVDTTIPLNTQTGASYTILTGDNTKIVEMTNASATTITIAVAGSAGFTSGWGTSVYPTLAATTVTPASGTICGLSAVSIQPGQLLSIGTGSGTNYDCAISLPASIPSGTIASGKNVGVDSSGRLVTATIAAGGNVSNSGTPTANQIATWVDSTHVQGITTGTGIVTALGVNTGSAGAPVLFNGALGTPTSGTLTNATGLPIATGVSGLGTGVATAAAANLSAAGGLTTTIASGTSALGTSAISSAACATAVTTTATNTATTDVISWGFNGDPTAVTGYVPLTAGMLTIISYPSANNVNFKVCNNTSSSITPGAITLNWRVTR